MTNNEKQVMAAAPYFCYRDAPAAIEWLERAFGFETTMRYDDDRGQVMHSELRREDVVIIVFSDDHEHDRPVRNGETVGHGVYVHVPDESTVDAMHAGAVRAGGTVVWEPATTEWNYRCRILDPEGYEWSFGIHRPGMEETEDWTAEQWSETP